MPSLHQLLFSFTALLIGLVQCSAQAAVVIGVDPVTQSVIEGTPSVRFDVLISPTAGDEFNGFTLAFGIGDGGAALGNGDDDADNLPILSFEPGSIFDGTDFTATISGGGLGQSAMLIDFARAGGNQATIPADGVLASFTIDTSNAVIGQTFVIDPNVGDFTAAAGAGGTALTIQSTAGELTINAIPEPSCTALMAVLGIAGISSRRRRG